MKKYQKGFAPILILLVIALAAVGYFAYQNYQLRKIVNNPSASVSPISTPTSDWKIYTNTAPAYSFSYPSNLTLKGANTLRVFLNEPNKSGLILEINKYEKTSVNTQFQSEKSGFDQTAKLQDVEVAGENAKQAIFKNVIIENETVPQMKILYFQKGLDVIAISLNDNTLDNQILSTFKFTSSPTPTSETSVINYPRPDSWRTANIPAAGVSVCLPPQWKVDPSNSTQIVFERDPGYKPNVGMVTSYPYKGGSRREEYLNLKTQYEYDPASLKSTARITEIKINGQSVLNILINSFPEAYVLVLDNKLYEVTAQEPSYVNSSRALFNKDFYTMLGCLKPL